MTYTEKIIYRIEATAGRERLKALRGNRPGYMSVTEVAAVLGVSEDTVLRQFGAMPGVIDLGVSQTLHKRQKRLLRISEATLARFIADRQVKVRARR